MYWCFSRVVGVDACFPIWSWEIKSEVKLAVNTDLTVKYHDLIHMAFWSHDIVPLILKRIVQECKSNIGHYKKGGMCPLANCAYTIEIKADADVNLENLHRYGSV
jgi:hypothetical protein